MLYNVLAKHIAIIERQEKLTFFIIAEPDQYGIWLNECGKTYLLGKEIVQNI
jgi:hypothetical protein